MFHAINCNLPPSDFCNLKAIYHVMLVFACHLPSATARYAALGAVWLAASSSVCGMAPAQRVSLL